MASGGLPDAETPPRFYDLLRVLCEHEVGFVLIGGFAVTLQGYVRTTKDIDIVPDPTGENPARLWDALASVDARPAEVADEGGGNRALRTTLGRLDLITQVEDTDGEFTYDELRANADRVDLPEVGHPIWVASIEHLIGMKARADRDLDRIDITALRMAHGLEDD